MVLIVAVLVVAAVVVSLTSGRPWSTVFTLLAAESVVYAAIARRPAATGRAVRLALLLTIPVLLALSLALPVSRTAALEDLFGVVPPGGEAEIIQVTPSTDEDTERLTVRIRNDLADPLPLGDLHVVARSAVGGMWVDMGADKWHFTIDETVDVETGFSTDGARMRGRVAVDGSEFTLPLVGSGFTTVRGGWERQLAFSTGALVPPDTVSTLVIDIPMNLTVRQQGSAIAGTQERTMRFADSARGQFTVHVGLGTPTGNIGGCFSEISSAEEKEKVCEELRDRAGRR
ncbi:hypothetical protein [Saccharothrix xinjiangensis]|uniref:hypothetical protein n=1 Tax=Saccharothrix xinjiangensis TaxID=204798 RepID=UPI0031D6D035